MKIRGQEVLLPTKMLGAYVNPRWYDSTAATYNLPFGELLEDAYETEVFEDALATVIHDQERAGLDVIVDARVFAAGSYAKVVAYYIGRLSGYVPYGPYLPFPLYSTLFSPNLVGPVKRAVPIMTPIAKVVKKHTSKPVQIQYTATGTLANISNDLYYKKPRDRAMAIAEALNEDIQEVDALGVEFIQLDEWFWPYTFEAWSIDAFNRTVEGIKNAKIIVHLCIGNYMGGRGYHQDDTAVPGKEPFILYQRKGDYLDYASVIPKAYNAKIDILNMQVIEEMDLAVLEALKKHPLPAHLDLWVGVIDVKSTYVETAEEVAARIRRVLQVVPPEKVGLTVGCGFKNMNRLMAFQKLRALVEGTKLVRNELTGKKKVA